MSRLPVLILDESTEASDEQAMDDLLTAHFQGEHRHRRLGGNMRCDIERERALSHSRSPDDHDQVGGVETGEQLVDPVEPGLGASDVTTRRTEFLDALKGGIEHRTDGGQALSDSAFGHGEDFRLGTVEHLVDGDVSAHRQRPDFATGTKQTTTGRGLIDNCDVEVDIGGGRDRLHEAGDEPDASDPIQQLLAPQPICDRDRIDRLAGVEECGDCLPHRLVRRLVEVVGLEDLERDVGGFGGRSSPPRAPTLRHRCCGALPPRPVSECSRAWSCPPQAGITSSTSWISTSRRGRTTTVVEPDFLMGPARRIWSWGTATPVYLRIASATSRTRSNRTACLHRQRGPQRQRWCQQVPETSRPPTLSSCAPTRPAPPESSRRP